MNFPRCRYSYYVYLHVTEGLVQEAACIIRFKTDMIEKKITKTLWGTVFQVFLSKPLKKNLQAQMLRVFSHLHSKKAIISPYSLQFIIATKSLLLSVFLNLTLKIFTND